MGPFLRPFAGVTLGRSSRRPPKKCAFGEQVGGMNSSARPVRSGSKTLRGKAEKRQRLHAHAQDTNAQWGRRLHHTPMYRTGPQFPGLGLGYSYIIMTAKRLPLIFHILNTRRGALDPSAGGVTEAPVRPTKGDVINFPAHASPQLAIALFLLAVISTWGKNIRRQVPCVGQPRRKCLTKV